jgi:hypothetical protein
VPIPEQTKLYKCVQLVEFEPSLLSEHFFEEALQAAVGSVLAAMAPKETA